MKQILRLLLTAALFAPLLLCSGCASLFFLRPSSSASSQPPVVSQPAVSQQQAVLPAAPAAQAGLLRYCRQLLSGHELDLYLRVLEAVQNAEPAITCSSSDLDTMRRMVDYVRADYPELFWLLGVNSSTITTVNGVPTEAAIEFRYSGEAADPAAAQARVEAAAQECLSGIDPAWSDYDKLKAVYDWVIRRTEYDVDAADQSLYTVLVCGRGVCAGYAKTTQYLLNRLGIPCTYVTGTARGGAHGWNLVLADGDWYYLDPTWGDPLFSGGEKEPDYVSYNYFCVTSEELFQTHTPDDTFPLPQCTATACNYFVRSGLLLDRYDYDTVLDIMRRAAAQRQSAAFRFTTSQALVQAVDALTRQYDLLELVKDTDGGSGILDTSTVYHSTDEKLNIFTIYFTFQ